MGTEDHGNLPMEARPMVTAGVKCAPLKAPTAYTATATPNAHPAVMTIHPLFWPLVLLSTTLATTPSPRMINSMVPSTSARKGDIELDEEGAKLSARQRLVHTRLERRRRSREYTSPDHRATVDLEALLIEQVRGVSVHAEVGIDAVAGVQVHDLARRNVPVPDPCRPMVPGHDARIHAHIDALATRDRKSTRLNSSHLVISYAVFCLKKKKK